MKKLLIAMTAAAVGTCAWAEEVAGGEGDSTSATPTMLNETFGANWTLQAPWSYWSGAETAIPADGELTAGDALSLNTGSKVLRGNFMSDRSAKDIDTGLYFNATVTFKDPSDTLPTLGEADKFALVVLDNVESIDAGYTATPATNLWVIAKYGESGQRAYQLNVEVDPTWLAAEHKIVVKAYNNVMANGNCAGFLVKVDNEDNDTVCTVVKSCAIVNGVIDYGTSCAYDMWLDGADKNLGYLGYPKAAILGAVQKRYTDATLILSNVPVSDKLTSVDFQGQGDIDDVSLATTGEGFGTDSLALTVVADGVTLVDTDETLYFAAIGDKVTIKFSVNEGYELSSPTGLTPVDGVYTYEYETTANNEKVTISAFKPVAIVDGTKYETVQAALEAIAENGGTGTVVLNDNVTLTDDDVDSNGLTITSGEITIDLNGNTIVAEECYTIGVTGGKLIVQDSKGGGAILASEGYGAIDASAGVTEIQAGTIGLIVNSTADTLKLVGGSYTDVGETFYLTTEQMKYGDKQYEATLADGVWTVAEKVVEEEDVFEESKKLVDTEGSSATADQIDAALEDLATALGATVDKDVAVTNYITKAYGNGGIKVDVLLAVGDGTAKNLDISIKYNLPVMTSDNAEFSVESSATTGDNVAAFEFSLNDGGTVRDLAEGVLEKALELIQVRADLSDETSWGNATANDVDYAISNGKLKVQLKKNGKGFMKLQAK